MHTVCAHGNQCIISLVYAQTVYQVLHPGLPHLLAQVVQLLPLAQQLVQVGDSPLILNLNINQLFFSYGTPQFVLTTVPGTHARGFLHHPDIGSSCGLNVPGHQIRKDSNFYEMLRQEIEIATSKNILLHLHITKMTK